MLNRGGFLTSHAAAYEVSGRMERNHSIDPFRDGMLQDGTLILDRISACVETIYASIFHPDLLPECYDEIARLLGGIGTVLIPVESDPILAPYVSGNLVEAMRDYHDRWWWQDPGVEAARRLKEPLGVYATEDIVDAQTMRTHPMYTEFGPKFGFRYFLSMTIAPLPGVYLILSVQRHVDAGPVTPEERAIAAIIRDHLIRSTRIRHQTEHLNRMAGAIFDKLEQSVNGMALVNADGLVAFTNAAMERFRHYGVRIAEGRMELGNSAGQKALNAMLARCLRADTARDGTLQKMTTIPVPGKLPLIVRCSAFLLPELVERGLLRDMRDFALLTILDPNLDATPRPLEELQALGLTARQALLASLVGSGRRIQDIAQEMGVTTETVRTHLKAVFARLGVESQSQLSALVSRLR